MASNKKDRRHRDLHVCKEHADEPLKFYCTLHNDVICSICAIKPHKKCNDILTFSEAIERFERENKNLHKALENQSFTIEHTVSAKKDHLCNIKSKSGDIRSNVEKVCASLYSLIDIKKTEVLENLEAMEARVTTQVTTDIDHLEELARSTTKVKTAAEKAFVKTSAVCTIKTMVRVQNAYCDIERSSKGALERTENTIDFQASTDVSDFIGAFQSFGMLSMTPQDLDERDGHTDSCTVADSVAHASVNSDGFPMPDASLEKNWSIDLIDFLSSPNESETSSDETSDEVEDILTSGDDNDVTTGKTSSTKPPPEDGAIVTPCSKPATKIVKEITTKNITKFQTIDHGKPCWLYGIAFLPDGRLTVSDVSHDSLQLYDAGFQFLAEEMVDFTPWGLTVVPDEVVAVCAGGKGSVNLFSVHADEFCPTRKIEVGIDCISVAYVKDTFFIGTRQGTILVSADGQIISTMDTCMDGQPVPKRADFLTVDDNGERMYIANSWASKIMCVSTSGEQIWENCQRYTNPRGLVWSGDKLVIVNRYQNKVTSLDKDGANSDDMIVEGLEYPYAISLLPELGICAVTQWDEKMPAEKTRTLKLFRC